MMNHFDAPDWVQDAIFYQIFPDRFANGDPSNDPPWVLPWGTPPTPLAFMGGDLQGILDRLPYLADLGINAIYTTPIFTARSNHKYDTCDYFQVDPAFGDLALLKKLVNAAHAQGIRVVLDAVFNHCGDGFWAFQDVMRNGRKSPYWDWFVLDQFPIEQDPPNYQTCGGAGFLPKLNTDNPQVRQHLLDASVYWLKETGMDGWRLDVPWKVPVDFWREFRKVVKQTNPQAYIVAEAWRDNTHWLDSDTCDGTMNYPLRDYILDYCGRDAMDAEDFDHFSRRLLEVYGPAAPYQLNMLGNHDTARILNLCREDSARTMLAMICLYTAVGAPMIYYGDENGMAGENDPDCRRCMPWDEKEWNPQIRALVKRLIALRRAHPALRRGAYESLLTYNGVYAFRRQSGSDQVVVITNPRMALSRVRIPLPGAADGSQWVDVLSGKTYTSGNQAIVLLELPAKTGIILLPVQDGR